MTTTRRDARRPNVPIRPSRLSFLLGSVCACIVAALPEPSLAALSVMYANSDSGDDASDGTSPSRLVRTLAQARSAAGATRWNVSHNRYVAARGREASVFERADLAAPFLGFTAISVLTREKDALETDDPIFVDAAAGDFRLASG